MSEPSLRDRLLAAMERRHTGPGRGGFLMPPGVTKTMWGYFEMHRVTDCKRKGADPMADLFDGDANRLEKAGCTRAGKTLAGGKPLWKLPDGRVMEEAAALRWLEEGSGRVEVLK